MRWKRILVLAAVLLGAFGTAGVLASVSGSPVGTWTARLSRAQMINEGLDPRLAGPYRLVLRSTGTYTTFNSLDGRSRGRFTVSGRTIVFFGDVNCSAAGLDGKSAYTWSIARGRLRLTSVIVGGDPCGGRWQTLTYPLWKRA